MNVHTQDLTISQYKARSPVFSLGGESKRWRSAGDKITSFVM